MTRENVAKVSEKKIAIVEELVEKIKSNRTLLIASTKNLPSSQFHEIKKGLRGKAEIVVAKKTAVIRAIGKIEKGVLQNLKNHITADIALFFSNLDPFELSSLLADNQSEARAKAGDIALDDINIEPGPTSLVPGPAISELSSVGLKVAVESGKLTIKQGTTIKKGETIKENAASVLAKLDIMPMKVGFEPLVAYDSKEDKIFEGIKIDKKGTLEELREAISRALGFSINIKYVVKETLSYFFAKAIKEERAIESFINKVQTSKMEVK